MKKIIIITLSLLVFLSCKKEHTSQTMVAGYSEENKQAAGSLQKQKRFMEKVKKYLTVYLSPEDYNSIDFKRVTKTTFDSGKIFLLRLQFIKTDNEFILLRTDSLGNSSEGLIINIKQSTSTDQIKKKYHLFNGNIAVSNLNRISIKNIIIQNGFNLEVKDNAEFIVPADAFPSAVESEDIVPGGGISFADWYNLLDIFSPSDLGYNNYGGAFTNYGYYGPIDPYSGYSGSGGYIPTEEPKEIEIEYIEQLPEISIDAYMKCFDDLSDNGATCSIEILTDLPVNGEPNTFFSWENGSPGHTFLQIKKANGNQSVQQNIGFYPDQGWKTVLTPAPVTGKFVDNASHKFNAGYKLNITTAELHTVINEIKYLSGSVKYDIDEYNCTDFALQVFNMVHVGGHLEIPKYDIPGGMAINGTNTPQGLYQKLMSIAEEGGTEATNITIPGVAGWVGISHGPCN